MTITRIALQMVGAATGAVVDNGVAVVSVQDLDALERRLEEWAEVLRWYGDGRKYEINAFSYDHPPGWYSSAHRDAGSRARVALSGLDAEPGEEHA